MSQSSMHRLVDLVPRLPVVLLAIAAGSAGLLAHSDILQAAPGDDGQDSVHERPTGNGSLQSPISIDEAQSYIGEALASDFPWPIYFFKCSSQWLDLLNWTPCTLYFITFLDCDGDGIVDSAEEHFVGGCDPVTGYPSREIIVPSDGCTILYWGMFDVIPWGACLPAWEQSGLFPSCVHFY
jgi:hypothetical protein